jgi:OCT family organic cation transporter-like MFS transporter 4/5
MTYPKPKDSKSNLPWDSCSRLDVNFSNPSYFEDGIPANGTVGCNGDYVYDTSKYESSARIDVRSYLFWKVGITNPYKIHLNHLCFQYDLLCNRNFLYTNAQNLFMVGIMVGSMLFGDLSDRFGRRPIFFLSLVLQVVFGILAGLAPEYWTFVIARMVVGYERRLNIGACGFLV